MKVAGISWIRVAQDWRILGEAYINNSGKMTSKPSYVANLVFQVVTNQDKIHTFFADLLGRLHGGFLHGDQVARCVEKQPANPFTPPVIDKIPIHIIRLRVINIGSLFKGSTANIRYSLESVYNDDIIGK